MVLRRLDYWDCGFEFRRGHGCLSVVNVVCYQVEAYVSGWSLVQRSPTECGVSECDRETSTVRRPCLTRDYCAIKKLPDGCFLWAETCSCDWDVIKEFCLIICFITSAGLIQRYCGLVSGRRLRLKCDGTRAETRFRLSAKRTSPFKSAEASVQSTTGSRGVRISGSNDGYTMFRGSVRALATHSIHQFSLRFPSRASPCAITFQLDFIYLQGGPRWHSG